MSDRSPCVRCGMLLHLGDGRVTVSFTAAELDAMVGEVGDDRVAERLACALGLLDEERELEARRSREGRPP